MLAKIVKKTLGEATEVPPHTPTSAAKINSPLQEMEDLVKLAKHEKDPQRQSKKRCLNKGKALLGITIGMNPPTHSSDDVRT
jgi:hypothetical protein